VSHDEVNVIKEIESEGVMGGCQLDIVDKTLKRAFYKLGRTIGEQPGYFLIVPILLSALCASGFQRVQFEADPEYLFSPVNGQAKGERDILDAHFPTNYSMFDPSRASKAGRFGRLLITAEDGGSLLRTKVWREIHFLNQVVMNITVPWEGAIYDYQQLCALNVQGYCWDNEILDLGVFIDQIERKDINLTYPIWISTTDFTAYTFPQFFGGTTLSEIGTIEDVQALSLTYFLDAQEKWMVGRGAVWEAHFLAKVKAQDLPNIKVHRFSSLTLEQELEENTNSVIPYFSLNIGIMILFCIMTCMMTDWVKSKPLLGLFGVVSAILGSISAFGLVMYLGQRFIGINLAAPFLMLGIGIDDTFVMLAAWRRTSVHDSVPERMGACYREAAVSITITSITDMLSFWVGVITPFPCVQIFCVYTGTCVIFTYLWHITFFGGCMAVAGYAEKNNRHALTGCVVLPKSQAGSKGFFYSIFCSGGINEDDPFNPKDNKENGMMVFFRDVIGTWLNKGWAKAIVLIVFLAYLGVASWGVTNLKEGLEKSRLSRFDSYSVGFYEVEDKYFREFPFRINVVVSGALDYSSPKIQNDLQELMGALENTTYINPVYTESWMRSFLEYVQKWMDYSGDDSLNISNEQSFVKALKEIYIPGTAFVQDIDFETVSVCDSASKENCRLEEHIVGSRFLLQGWNIRNANDEAAVVKELRAVCDASPYNVTVFNPYFIYFDQFLVVLPTTVQCVCIAAVVMMIVSLIFIPNPVCSVWVAFSIVSIELGVLGFMTFWGINLDSISMINLIMCIGFSVDFAAHISYHYMSSEGTPDERVKNSLYGLGAPIVQGAVSTILGVIGLMLAPSYIFVTFFKMVFLVICLGALHGLFLLPVLLSIFGPGSCSSQSEKKSKASSTSFISDEDSLKTKTDSESKQSSVRPSPLPASHMRIPRPTASSDGSHRGEKNKHRPRGRAPIHELYHNNGYVSEEGGEREFRQQRPDMGDSTGHQSWPGPQWGGPVPVGPNFHYGVPGYPALAYSGPPSSHHYRTHSFPSQPTLRPHSKERKCKGSKGNCKRKKPKM